MQASAPITAVNTIADRLRDAREAAGLSQAALAKAAGVQPGTIGNIESGAREQPRRLIEIAQVLGVHATWLKTGMGPRQLDADSSGQPPATGPVVMGVAQNLSPFGREATPRHVDWELLMKSPLEAEFQTVMPDSSMAPEVPKGARVMFVTDVEPMPGDLVLVADADEMVYLREFKQLRPGQWEAHALNPAYLPMDGASLRVLAVFDGIRGRRAR